ncbi:hypothetical protein BGZ97_003617, partial [Linnemannia gamsii]
MSQQQHNCAIGRYTITCKIQGPHRCRYNTTYAESVPAPPKEQASVSSSNKTDSPKPTTDT